MTVAIFDLDFTIIEGDTEWLWGEFLTEKGIVDQQFMRDLALHFQLYQSGSLDIHDYMKYFLSPLSQMEPDVLVDLLSEFLKTIRKLWRPGILERIEWHRRQNHTTVLLSASNQILVKPISEMLNFSHTICTEVEISKNRPTGEILGIPVYKEGKVENLNHWLLCKSFSMDDSWVYGDSLNDIPVLEQAEYPVAVTPDSALRKYALLKGWRIMDL